MGDALERTFPVTPSDPGNTGRVGPDRRHYLCKYVMNAGFRVLGLVEIDASAGSRTAFELTVPEALHRQFEVGKRYQISITEFVPRPVIEEEPDIGPWDTAKPAFLDLSVRGSPPVSVRYCLALVSAETGVFITAMRSRRQDRRTVRARHLAMWLARHATEYSLPEIGGFIGDRDHTTVMDGVRRIDQIRAADPALRDLSDRLLAKLIAARESEVGK